MIKATVIFDASGMFPVTEHSCPSCKQLHQFYSMPQKECSKCGEKLWNVRTMKNLLSYRIEYYRGAIDDKNICCGK